MSNNVCTALVLCCSLPRSPASSLAINRAGEGIFYAATSTSMPNTGLVPLQNIHPCWIRWIQSIRQCVPPTYVNDPKPLFVHKVDGLGTVVVASYVGVSPGEVCFALLSSFSCGTLRTGVMLLQFLFHLSMKSHYVAQCFISRTLSARNHPASCYKRLLAFLIPPLYMM
ncbi:hypothetical protein CALVIDRAFT_222812 [Calocera viscosa TUFC12733]|uniref:Uncharacterized protein n=1 Tax=Calocera viscosa (strain TUFC12733) TaxID=1330018 RepID=A0A167K6N9_CALVF|nr:hypothetical protein CALVIDRAFT_222812 [Calocera viscosa TUFC12733]